jgi:hypothetical protein
MRTIKLFLISTLFSLGLYGDASLTGKCPSDGTYPNCVGGEIIFTGSAFNAQVHVTVTNSAGKVIDDGDYTTNAGVLTFTENLSFADTYTIAVDSKAILTVTTS